MRTIAKTTDGPAAGERSQRLPARVFYGVIGLGMSTGVAVTVAAAASWWTGSDSSGRLWLLFLTPVVLGSGLTLGGLVGLLLALLLERSR